MSRVSYTGSDDLIPHIGFHLVCDKQGVKLKDGLNTYFPHVIKYLNAISVFVGLWAFLFPFPYRLAIALNTIIFLSAITAFVYSKGAIPLDEPKKSKKVHVSYAVVISSLALAWRGFFDFHFVNSRDLIVPVGIVFFCLSALLYLKTRDFKMRKARTYLTVFLFLFAFSFGAVTEINGLFPAGRPVEYKARIINKQISSGTDGPDLYYLMATPWGERKSTNKLVVSKRIFDSFKIDDEVTLLVRPGAFNIPHYRVVRR